VARVQAAREGNAHAPDERSKARTRTESVQATEEEERTRKLRKTGQEKVRPNEENKEIKARQEERVGASESELKID
jgi:hypothetical protein